MAFKAVYSMCYRGFIMHVFNFQLKKMGLSKKKLNGYLPPITIKNPQTQIPCKITFASPLCA